MAAEAEAEARALLAALLAAPAALLTALVTAPAALLAALAAALVDAGLQCPDVGCKRELRFVARTSFQLTVIVVRLANSRVGGGGGQLVR